MKLLQILGAGALAVAAGCQSQAAHVHDHWSGFHTGPSMTRAFLSYDPETDGTYRDFQWRKKKNIELTVRRHLFNHNPDNPFQVEDPTFYDPRPPHSLLPRPWNYIHLEGLAFGAIALARMDSFIPIPVDSLIATFETGGGEEFVEGVSTTFRPLGVITTSFLHDSLGLRGEPSRR